MSMPETAAAPACPYADDGVVYTILLAPRGRTLTGRFFASHLVDAPFWTMEVDNEASWIAVNPVYIETLQAAEGDDYTRFMAAFPGTEA